MRRRHDPLESPGALLDRVYAYVAYRIGAGPVAEDITSDVLERALRYRSSYDPSRGSPEAWVIGIARRCIADTAASPPTYRLDDEEAAPEVLEERATRRVALAAALASLTPRERDLIALRYGAGFRSRQIASLLDMKPGAVDVALHRALARLREVMDEPADDVRNQAERRYTQHETRDQGG